MTSAQLQALAASVTVGKPCHIAGLPHRDAAAMAALLSCPLHDYEGRDDGCYTCRPGSFSLALVELPPDDEGRRVAVETRLLARLRFAAISLVTGGVIALEGHPGDVTSTVARWLTARFDPIFQDGRLIVGVKIDSADNRNSLGTIPRGITTKAAFSLPASVGPGKSWRKIRANDDEIAAVIAAMDASRVDAPSTRVSPSIRPLLPLNDGHLAQAVASGLLDGPITLADGSRAVIRGSSGKSQYKKPTSPLRTSGKVCDNTVVYGERPSLSVRLVDEHGRFSEFLTESES